LSRSHNSKIEICWFAERQFARIPVEQQWQLAVFDPQQEHNMAIDVYLQIDGIKGESQDSGHQGWIEVSSAHWGVIQPRSASVSTGGGHTAERCEHLALSLSKLADLASPVLMQTCSMGKTIPKAKLEFMRADGAGKPVKYYEVELENVMIASVEQQVSEGSILNDSIGLHFSKVTWRYTQQRIGGGASGATAGGWDLSSNKTA
jgi:type VI secretion system secreted protein Hcp